ncbi:MAG: tRNA 5-methoxyuridine(34)/uridine 5-oxyacetic acid(34) synthase CmoB, partial [Deltaproteobacteria bacterium]
MDLAGSHVLVGDESDIPVDGKSGGKSDGKKDLHGKLAQLSPWRKGPFNIFGVDIDTEWQSWMKWDRLLPHLPELSGRRILDIGS